MDKSKVSPGGEPDRPAQSQANPPRRILVVDDDEHIRRLNAKALSQYGHHVDVAEDGVMAWEALQQHQYDLLVTDNEMPNLSGVELLHKLRAARLALPVIMATGTLPADLMETPWPHAVATLLKPYTPVTLLAAVHAVLPPANPAPEPKPSSLEERGPSARFNAGNDVEPK